ncbi:putative potassium/sodium hyperpolarization-activated cyclic nucleotide-gated channel 4-like [Scophthalmus maximus]|uniref:Putative potassium/sodium hyperpolarization-activated cyclic nucleotide-gated channel 4-like n=2 Tax=Scophthalmus maximus TaxID=52904 RepID=A0A2U9CAC6_SCOMX|nr:potassium/sodium hyperpolarization-activated cyclic nucleotide-gated channel 2 isoform X1 [Scophthalmus maximus]AWP13541.1 putative potassium/sodium hyperpolarization-activated cyclic nucleotide-gated channel 4-like [Scophthalmus maximus]
MEKLKGPVGGCTMATCGWRALLLPQLNRQSLYLYGSEVAVEQECLRQLQSGVFVIHPFSLMRSYYIMCMMAITFLNLIGIPMEIAFLDGTSGLAWEGFNVFSDTLFLIDVALNFRMGIIAEDSEEAILDIKRIRLSYLRTWFIPDVIAAFPIGYILLFADLHYHNDDNPSKTNKMMRILMFVRILSLIRLARVSRLVRFFNEVEKVSNANLEVVRLFFRILSLFMMIFLLCHWNGCIQYFVPMLEEFPSDCWVRKENLMNATVIVKYSWGVFRALSQMIALSYGSMDAPTNYVEMWIVMVSMVSGCLMYTVLVANATAMIANTDPAAKEYKSKMSRLEHYMGFMKLPPELQLRISNYYQARYGGKWFDEKDVMDTVSSALKEQILTVMCSRLLRKAPLFQNTTDNFLSSVLPKLEYEVFQEGDVIVHQNMPGDRMFFIDHGQVLIETDSDDRELCDGDFFGETCVLTKGKHLATVKALTDCQCFTLSCDDFREVLEGFPDVKREVEKMVPLNCDDGLV